MSELCGCSKDKNRKPIVISIEGVKDETTGKPKEIEIVVCPHSKDEQPCACGGTPFPGFEKIHSVPEGGGSGLYAGQQPAYSSSSRPSVGSRDPNADERGRAPGSMSNALGRSSGASQNTLDDYVNKDFTRLPIVSPRYHGPACVLEVNVMEKHEDGCPYKKLPNDKRHPIDDKLGPYEVVGRMVFKTCNPEDSDYVTTSDYDSGLEGPPQTQIEVAEIIPLLQLQKSVSDKNLTNMKISLPHSKEAKNMNDLKNILTKRDTIQKLAGSSKQFIHTANVSIQTPILASKEICTDDDLIDIRNDTDDDGDDDEEEEDDDLDDVKENEAPVTEVKQVENDETDTSKAAKISANRSSREYRNVNEFQANEPKDKADNSQRKKIQKIPSVMKRTDVDSSGKNVSTMTALHIGMLDDNVHKRPR